MPASANRGLFIQIGGSASDLTIAAKAGKSALLDLGSSADDVQTTVREAFEKLGGSVADQAKAMEDAYSRTFANIRTTAQAALSAPTPKAQAAIIDVAAARQEADQAQNTATYLRTLADAQARLVDSGREASAGARSLAVSLELQAIAAEKNALAATETVGGLERLAVESGIATERLDEVAGAHGRMGASGLIAEHVVRSFADSITAGQSPVRAFALELPRLTEAIQFFAMESGNATGALGTFAKFMGGPWGLAITLGTSLLAPLVAGLFEGGKASDEMHGKVESLVAALNDEEGATAAARKALEAYNAEKQRGRDQDAAATQATLDKAKADLQAAVAIRTRLQAEAQRYFNESQQGGGATGGAATAFAGLAFSQRADSQSGLIATLQQNIRNIEIDQAKDAAKSAADPLEAIRVKYKQLAEAAEAAAAKNDRLAASLKGTLSGYAREEAAEIKAEQAKMQEQRRETTANRQVGRQIDLSQAEDIVRGIGGRVTSAQRSTAEQQVLYNRYLAGTGSIAAKPGTSLHERGEALDVAKTAGISLGALKKAFEDAGVHLTEALDEGNHYHIGFGPKGPSADTLQRRAQADAHRQQSAENAASGRDETFQNDLRGALDGLAAARERQPQTPEQEYRTTTDKLQDDVVQQDAALQDKVDAGKLTAAQALEIEAILNATTQLNTETAKRKELAALLDQQARAEDASIEAQNGLLQARLGITDGRENQKSIASQILANKQRQESDRLNRILNPDSGATDDQRADARIKLQTLPDQQAAERIALDREYASPAARYRQSLDGTSIGDSLEQVGVDGLGHLQDGLEGVLDGTKSVKQAFTDMAKSIIADLAKVAVEQAIIKPIVGFLGFGLADGGVIPGHADGLIPGFATGATASVLNGVIRGPGTGRSDSILAMLSGGHPIRVSNGEAIITAAATRRHPEVIRALNDNTFAGFADGGIPGGVPAMPSLSARDVRALGGRSAPGTPVTFDLRGAVMTEDLLKQMNSISQQHSAAAVVGGSQMAQREISEQQHQAIPS